MNSRRAFTLVVAVVGMIAPACARDASNQRAPDSASTPNGRWDAAHRDTLLRLGREDQDGREDLAKAAVAQDTGVLFAMIRADSARTRWLRAAVAQRGWPTRSSPRDSAPTAAWLILQHSPDSAWQAAMLPELERLGRSGALPLPDLALLTDRILMHRGLPQRYGSQFNVVDGRLVAAPIEDLATLDARRAGMKLPPMAEYVKLLEEQSKLPVTWPPAAKR